MIGFIIGGVLLFIIVILAILCFFNRRNTPENHIIHEIKLLQPQTPTHPTPYMYRDPSGMLLNYPLFSITFYP